MYTDRFSLAFVTGVLVAAAELRRPGLGPWSPAVREELLGIFKTELASVKRSYLELNQDLAPWEKLERGVLDDAFPRYAAVAERQTALEQRDFGVWRGGDLLARLTYAGVGLVVGGLCVKLPFIPIPTEWDFFAFATMIGAPFVPDLQIGWHRWRYRRSVETILRELSAAEEAQKLYQPLGVGELEARPSPVSEVASSDSTSSAATRVPDSGGKNGDPR